MSFDQQKIENYTLVTSTDGKLNVANAPELKAVFLLLNKSAENNIVLDLTQSKYCDSSGLSAILIGNRLCKDSGGIFILCGLQPNVKKLIEISQLDSVLNITENATAAGEMIKAVH